MTNVAYIIGGTGTLGSALVKRLYDTHEIYVISRDECKQKALKAQYPNIQTHLCDIRDISSLAEIADEIDLQKEVHIYHCAALKHVDIGEQEVDQFIKTNYEGLKNSYKCFEKYADKFVFFTTDKAVMPINAYGMTKGLAEKYLLSKKADNIEIYRWGNIIGSRGSIIETLLRNHIQNKITPITDMNMTRYWYKIEDAIDFVLSDKKERQPVYVPPDMKSATNENLINAIDFILEINTSIIFPTGYRPGEKRHEDIDLLGGNSRSRIAQFSFEELVEYIKPEVKRIWGELNARI